MNDLAIVIPAYKINFFSSVLNSLSRQTCKRFTVYIGEDCSKDDFKTLIERYSEKIDIVYQRFNENLGGKNLVAQWKRCIEMTQGEPWIWLFSDDDTMAENSVETFYKEIKGSPSLYDIYHFNVDIINEEGIVIKEATTFPPVISALDFYKMKQTARIESFVVEYIFSRKIYEQTGGFEHFEMAWGSDIATWCKMGQSKGIKTLYGSKIQWRSSNKNITPQQDNATIIRKLKEDIKFMSWACCFFNNVSLKQLNRYVFFRLLVHYSVFITHKQYNNIVYFANQYLCLGNYVILYRSIFPFIRISKQIKKFINQL